MLRHLEQPQILTANAARIALLAIEIAVTGIDLQLVGEFANQLKFHAFGPRTRQGAVALIVEQDGLIIAIETEQGRGQAEPGRQIPFHANFVIYKGFWCQIGIGRI